MKVEKFKIANKTKELIVCIDKYLINFPHKEIELKRSIKEASFKLLQNAYLANETQNIERRVSIQEEMIATIRYIDFLLNMCYDKQIINNKRYVRFRDIT